MLLWVFAKMQKEVKRKEDERKALEEDMDVDMDRDNSGVFVRPFRMDRSPTTDLLVDIEPGVVDQALPNEVRRPWITVEQALRIVQSVKNDFLTQAMERATLGRD